MSANRSPTLARSSLRLLPLQIVLRGSEAVFPLALAWWFGRSTNTDAFFVSFALFTLAVGVLGGVFRDSAVVPALIHVRTQRPDELPVFVGGLLGHAMIIALVAALCTGAVGLVLPGNEWPLVAALAGYTALSGTRSVLQSLLHAEGRFVVSSAAAAGGMLATVALAGGAARAGMGIWVVAPALMAGEALALIGVFLVVRRTMDLPLRPTLARSADLTRLARRGLSELAGSTIARVNPFVDGAMATATGVVGGATLLRFSADVSGLPTSLLQATLLPVLLSELSRQVAQGLTDRYRRTIRRTLWVVMVLVGTSCLVLHLARRPLLQFVFLHGRMDAAGVARMADLLPYHLAGMPAFAALLVLARAHTSAGNSRIMISMAILNASSNALLNLLLAPRLGLAGIALATSLVNTLVAVVFWVRLRACVPTT